MRIVSSGTATIFCMFALIATHAQSSASEATTAETAQFIQTHLIGLSSTNQYTVVHFDKHKPPREYRRDNHVFKYVIVGADIKGCSLTAAEQSSMDGTPDTLTTYTVSFAKLMTVTWGIMDKPPSTRITSTGTETTSRVPDKVGQISFHTVGSDVLRTTYTYDDKSKDVDPTGDLVLLTDDSEIGQRLVKALNHAVTLCKGSTKPEPF